MENNKGWIKLHRKIMDNPAYGAEPFCRMMAWIDLLLLANHSPGHFFVRGHRVDIERGQLGYAQETLSDKWGWSRGKVDRFLKMLEKDGKIIQQKSRLTTIISIINYDHYQGSNTTDDTTDGQQMIQQTDTNKNVKNVKNEKSGGVNFTPPDIFEVMDYMKSLGMDALLAESLSRRFVSHYTANGWRIRNSKIVNWRAKAETWVMQDLEKQREKEKQIGNVVAIAKPPHPAYKKIN